MVDGAGPRLGQEQRANPRLRRLQRDDRLSDRGRSAQRVVPRDPAARARAKAVAAAGSLPVRCLLPRWPRARPINNPRSVRHPGHMPPARRPQPLRSLRRLVERRVVDESGLALPMTLPINGLKPNVVCTSVDIFFCQMSSCTLFFFHVSWPSTAAAFGRRRTEPACRQSAGGASQY